MNEYQPYRIIADGRVLVDYGPITMSIIARRKGQADTQAAVTGAEKAIETLELLSGYLESARKPVNEITEQEGDGLPTVLKRMLEAVKCLDNIEFTAMAAVAGAFSDLVKEELLTKTDADYVTVNNGGDIAFHSPSGHGPFKVGVISDIADKSVTHALQIHDTKAIQGLATSGYGGRSLTKGIASAVTVLAGTASLADAAATEIANCTYIPSSQVKRCLAEELDYQTDIRGALVVESVGDLSRQEIAWAMEKGLAKARELYEKEMIQGAIIFIRGTEAHYPEDPLKFTINPR